MFGEKSVRQEMREVFIGVAIAIVLGGGFIWAAIALHAHQAERGAVDKRHLAWAAQHCKRTNYDNGDGVYICDDGNVYLLRDMP